MKPIYLSNGASHHFPVCVYFDAGAMSNCCCMIITSLLLEFAKHASASQNMSFIWVTRISMIIIISNHVLGEKLGCENGSRCNRVMKVVILGRASSAVHHHSCNSSNVPSSESNVVKILFLGEYIDVKRSTLNAAQSILNALNVWFGINDIILKLDEKKWFSLKAFAIRKRLSVPLFRSWGRVRPMD